jgi:hypothetical protein
MIQNLLMVSSFILLFSFYSKHGMISNQELTQVMICRSRTSLEDVHLNPLVERLENSRAGQHLRRLENSQAGQRLERLESSRAGQHLRRLENNQAGQHLRRLENSQLSQLCLGILRLGFHRIDHHRKLQQDLRHFLKTSLDFTETLFMFPHHFLHLKTR